MTRWRDPRVWYFVFLTTNLTVQLIGNVWCLIMQKALRLLF